LIFDSLFQNAKTSNNEIIKEEISKIMVWLRGNSSLEKLSDIWKNKEELANSNLDKISYENLLIKLEKFVELLISQKQNSILDIEEFQNFSSPFISQNFFFVDEFNLVVDVIQVLLEDYRMKGNSIFKEKKEFLLNIFAQYDFIIPTKRLKFKLEGINFFFEFIENTFSLTLIYVYQVKF
jgi:hypothetical protein